MSSKRLPGKALMDIAGKSLIARVWEACEGPWKRIILTSSDKSDDVLVQHCLEHGMDYRRGSLENVFSRYLALVEEWNPTCLVRVCGDAPFLEASWIQTAIESVERTNEPAYVIDALHAGTSDHWRKAWRDQSQLMREHAGDPWFRELGRWIYCVPEDYRMVNTQEDLEEARRRCLPQE